MSITVHHLENSRSQRILWLLEELGFDYTVKRYARDPATKLAPKALLDVHPLGKSPVITDGARVVAESGAIIEHLVDRHIERDGASPWRPAYGTEAHRQYTYWMHFAEGSAMPPLVMKLVFNSIRSAKMPFFAKPIAKAITDKVLNGFVEPNLKRQMSFINHELSKSTWFCGDAITAADVQMSFALEAAGARGGLSAASHPHAHAWLAKVHARPAYQRALERGGPYEILGRAQ